MIVTRIKPQKASESGGMSGYKSKGTKYTLKQMLLNNGLSEENIKQLNKEGKILISPSNLAMKLTPRQMLVIIEDLPERTQKQENLNRFGDIEE